MRNAFERSARKLLAGKDKAAVMIVGLHHENDGLLHRQVVLHTDDEPGAVLSEILGTSGERLRQVLEKANEEINEGETP